MKKGLLLLSVGAVLMVTGCSKQQEAPATSAATEAAAVVQEQAQLVVDQGTAAMDQAKENVQEATNDLSSQVQDLLAKAKSFVDSGNFDQAIELAQQVLKADPNNVDAQGIIETAKAKIAELAQQKAADLKNDLTNKLGAFGK